MKKNPRCITRVEAKVGKNNGPVSATWFIASAELGTGLDGPSPRHEGPNYSGAVT